MLLTYFALETGYRFKLYYTASHTEPRVEYKVAPETYIIYDEKHGEKFKPNHELWVSYVKNGEVVFGTVVSRSNSDGLGGRTTIKEYESSSYKVLIFGDSFTHWNQNNASWPDLFQNSLNQSLGKKVAVLNYARGTYGILQMLDLAAEEVQERKPDLVIIAALGDDFTRDRWWCKEIEWHGFKRWMISSNKNSFSDYRYAVDEFLINPAATKEWCMNILNTNQHDDQVLQETHKQYLLIKGEVEGYRKKISLLSFDESYLFNRIVHGSPYRFAPQTIPRVSFNDYSDDKEAVISCEKLLLSNSKIRLVYLPTRLEIEDRKTHMSGQAETLMHSLEKMLKTDFIFLQNEIDDNNVGKIDLDPYDGHPNYEGLVLYSQTLTKTLLSPDHPLHLDKAPALHQPRN